MEQDHTTEIPAKRSENIAATPERQCPKCGLVVPDALVCPQDGTSLMAEPGTVLANSYEFIKEIGRGGMSVIYRARQISTGKVVAIKMLQAVSVTEESLKRFYQEVKAISSLHHPNIISVHDFGVSDSGQPYMVMDFIEGASLGEVIKEKGALSLEESLHRFIQLCDALGHAHDVGVLHRDLKPRNIMLSSVDGNFEDARLVDFGIAKLLDQEGEDVGHLTQTGQLFGSPLYMSPEQCRAGRVDARTDIYSMGCVMYETLTGRPPLQGATILDTIMMQMNDSPQSLAGACPQRRFPQALENIIAKALAKDPADRFQTMQEMEMALMQIRPDLRVTGEQSARKKIRDKSIQVPRWVYFCFCCFAAALAVAYHWSTSQTNLMNYRLFNFNESSAQITQYRRKLLENTDRERVDDTLLADCLQSDLRMTALNLDGATKVDDSGAAHIAVLTSLQSLFMDDTKITDSTLATLERLPLLDTLHLLRTKVGNDGMVHLLKHKNLLKELYVTDTQVTDAGLSSIAKLGELKVLSIGYLKKVTDDGVLRLKDLKLQKLFLTHVDQLSDDGLAVVDNMPSLQELYLQDDTKITKDGLAHLQNLRNLKFLTLARTKLTGKALSHVSNLQALTTLQLGETSIGDDGIAYLQKLSSLKTLYLNNTKITDKALLAIGQMKSITQLNLASTEISDAGLSALKQMPQLGVLDLQNTNITDKGLQELRQYPTLRTLNVSNCRGITNGAVEKLGADPQSKFKITYSSGIW